MKNDILVKVFVALTLAMANVLYMKDPTGTQTYKKALMRYGKSL
jgi:hypothetical protein